MLRSQKAPALTPATARSRKWPCSTEVGRSVEDQRAGGIEDGFVVIAVELAAAEAAASRETTGSIGQILG